MQDFEQIIKDFHPIFYKISRAYTDSEDDFNDLFQEMLIQVWTSYKNFRNESKLSTWLYRLALNTALSFQRKNKKVNLATYEVPIVADDNSEAVEREQRIELLYSCIRELAKDERSLILLQLEGKSYDEMSEILGITTTNVGVKLGRIKKKLQSLLNEKGYGRI